jgi:uncharacterized protein YodC (DUF2158 family)
VTSLPKFSIGQTVWLKVGGPAMVVEDIRNASPACVDYICKWFDTTDQLRTAQLEEQTLTDSPSPSPDELTAFPKTAKLVAEQIKSSMGDTA